MSKRWLYLLGVIVLLLASYSVFAASGSGGCSFSLLDSDGLNPFSGGYVVEDFDNCSFVDFYDSVVGDGLVVEYYASGSCLWNVTLNCSLGVNVSSGSCVVVDRDGDGFVGGVARVVGVDLLVDRDRDCAYRPNNLGVGDVVYPVGFDCDDHNAGVNPGVSEDFFAGDCGDGLDNDCDGFVDGDDSGCPVCGNGVVEPGEECDDGNGVGFDGCSGCVVDSGVLGDFLVGFNVSVRCGDLMVNNPSLPAPVGFGDSCAGLNVSGSAVCPSGDDCLFFVNGSPTCVGVGGNISVGGRTLVCAKNILFGDVGVWCGSFRDENGSNVIASLDGDGNCVINYGFCDYLVGDDSLHNCSVGDLFGLFAVNLSSGELLCKRVGGVVSGPGCSVNFSVVNTRYEIIGLKNLSSFDNSSGVLGGCVHGSEYVCVFYPRFYSSCSVFSCPLSVLEEKGVGVFSLNPYCFGRLVNGNFTSVFGGARPLFDAWCGLVGLGGGFIGVPMGVDSGFLIR